MGETNGHAQENEDSGSLNKQTRKEKLTAKLSEYFAKEQYMNRAEASLRKQWKVCREDLATERRSQAELLPSTKRTTSQPQTPTEERRPNMKWNMCMVAIIALGMFAMPNSGKCPDTLLVQDWKEVTAKPDTKEGEETTINIEPVGKNHSKPLRGWRGFWLFKAIKPLKVTTAAPEPVGTHFTTGKTPDYETEPTPTNVGLSYIWTTCNGCQTRECLLVPAVAPTATHRAGCGNDTW